MSERDLRLRLYMELKGVGEKSLVEDVERVEKMVEAFLSAPALAGITLAQFENRKPKAVTAETRAKVAAAGKPALTEYFDHPTRPEKCAFLSVTLYDRYFVISATVERGELAKHRATALDDLVAAFVRAVEVWHGRAFVKEGWINADYVDAPDPPYARLHPPRTNRFLRERSLVAFLDRRFAKKADEFKALTEPKPAHARVTKHGDLVEIRWAKSLDDREIAQASTWHDCWIRRTVTEPDHRFNELGDERIYQVDGEAQGPLTIYNPWLECGLAAVAVGPKGEPKKADWDAACKVLKAKKLPRGGKVERIWIALPSREHAIALHDRVVAAGFEAAVYPGDEGEFWRPVPRVPWLTKSTDNGRPAKIG